MTPHFINDRILTSKERREMVPYSDMQIWRMERNGTFPKRIQLGPKRVGWSQNEIMDRMEERKAERS